MLLSRTTPVQNIEIWQPRWKDRVVLIAKHKVGRHNQIVFTKAPSLSGKFYVSGETATKCPIETNGTIACYAVPLSELEPLERK